MAVVGIPGFIGSSVVSETGVRYMSQAGSVLLNASGGFMMSAFANKARSFFLTVGIYSYETPLSGNQTDVGCGYGGYNGTPYGSLENAGGVWGGISTLYAYANSVSRAGVITGPNLPKKDLLLSIGGVNHWFFYQQTIIGGMVYESWDSDPSLYQFLRDRVGQRLECIPQN